MRRARSPAPGASSRAMRNRWRSCMLWRKAWGSAHEERQMTRKQRRGVLIGVGLAVLTVAVGLVLFALRDAIVFFHTPSDLVEKPIAAGERFRLGGLVASGSVKRGAGTKVDFVVTDTLK